MITTKLKDEGKKKGDAFIRRETIEKLSQESLSNQNIEIIDLKETFGLDINFIEKEKISRSESCV